MNYKPQDLRSGAIRVQAGTRLGSYEILLCIARGGMASVWAARQHGARGFSRLVALKTILPELAAPDLDGMFLDEARITARIHHPNVCEVFELIEHRGVLALSMEWVDGDTLNNLLGSQPKEPALDARIAAQIVANVACGLHAAHELRDDHGAPLQLVHRDVSPQNILISRSGHVKVTDFGVAKSLGGMREATAIGKVKGKLSYMSPEQAQGQLIDRRSDVFSLGVVLYLATVGSHPFRRVGDSRHQQLSRLLQKRAKLPSDMVPGYPPELEKIVMRALSRDPNDRYATADEMARRLQDWVLESGPLVTDQHIAQMVLKRGGAAILERSERIANLMVLQQQEPAAEEPLPSPNDPTLVPTTSRSGQSLAPERARNARATLRAVSTTLTAGAIALAASLVFSSPTDLRRGTLAAPTEVAPAQPVAPAPVQTPAPAPVPANDSGGASRSSSGARVAPLAGADARPAASARSAKASSTSTPHQSTSRMSAPKTSAPKAGAAKAATAKTGTAARSKARKPTARATRKKTTRRDELYGIKRGR